MIDQIELFPLGTCSANNNLDQKYSAYLLNFFQLDPVSNSRTLENQVLLDAGNDRIFDDRWVNPDQLSAIFITHSHLDHTYSLGKLCAFLKKKKRTQPFHIYYPITSETKIRFKIRFFNQMKIPKFIVFHPIDMNLQEFQVNQFIYVQSIPAIHSIPTLSYKFKITTSKSIINCVYTPDTLYNSPQLMDHARNADYWLLDTTFNDFFIENLVQKIRQKKHWFYYPKHSSPKYSAILCQQANVKNFIAIHYYWKRFHKEYSKVKQIIINSANDVYAGRTMVSEDCIPIILK